MHLDSHPARRTTIALAVAVAAAALLTFSACAAPVSPTPTGDGTVSDAGGSDAGSSDAGGAGGDAFEAVMPADFPDDILMPDGELISASGSSGRWVVVTSIDLLDQVTAAINAHVTSYGYTIDQHIEDDEQPSWSLSNDDYELMIDVRSGDPLTLTYVVDER